MSCNCPRCCGELICKNGRSVIWHGYGKFPKNRKVAKVLVAQHRCKIAETECPSKRTWHQQRICEITTIWPTLA